MKVALIVFAVLGSALAADLGKGLKISHGWEVPPHSIPFQVYIVGHGHEAAWFCSGTLISPNFVLTAAHCLTGAQEVMVHLGVHNVRMHGEPGSLQIGARKLIIHERYNQLYFDNDIALVELDGAVTPSPSIGFVNLPQRGAPPQDFVGNRGIVSGWGLQQDHQASDVLKAVEETIVPNDICFNAFQNVNDQELCLAGGHNGGPCRGDSGGPLLIHNVQEGIFSYGQPDCAPQWPAVFEKVHTHMEWIQTHSDHRG